ncbi:MAG: hypothetical protein ACI9TA_003498, partial [Reinekea sp.]
LCAGRRSHTRRPYTAGPAADYKQIIVKGHGAIPSLLSFQCAT